MAGEGKSDSTLDENIDLSDAGNNRWSLVTRLQGSAHLPEVVNITHEHQKVHEGEFFSTGYYVASVADDADIEMLIQPSADELLHCYVKLVCGGDAEFEVYENTTFSAAGTEITPVNHNRNSSNLCGCTVTHTPTITADGDLLWTEFVAGGAGIGTGHVTPGSLQNVGSEQFVTKVNTNYLFRLINRAGSSQPLQMMLSYYKTPNFG